ncbi:hypothetical protein HPP92_017819 [Vanilla planifolia]|uniref:Uncharacterized protein n=1 Tax=Vanilla planifolia TaxID=51239 RepID=A0A835UK86_VANPL|nr:hypothetical protein HPP92_017819 [Vanilla planifolia]
MPVAGYGASPPRLPPDSPSRHLHNSHRCRLLLTNQWQYQVLAPVYFELRGIILAQAHGGVTVPEATATEERRRLRSDDD